MLLNESINKASGTDCGDIYKNFAENLTLVFARIFWSLEAMGKKFHTTN
jgi:hypothetical protein